MHKQQGTTLIEILITIIIIVVGVMAIAKFQQKTWHHSKLLAQQNQALALAQSKLEQLRAFEVLATESGKFAYQDIGSGSDTITTTNTDYTINWNVTEATDPDYKTINVTVSWLDNHGSSHNINLTSIISKIDPFTTGNVFHNYQ
jgi:Tfp pilus assembly protein PilV